MAAVLDVPWLQLDPSSLCPKETARPAARSGQAWSQHTQGLTQQPWWLSSFASAVRVGVRAGGRVGRVRRSRVALAASPVTELLVDADTRGIEQIQHAIRCLTDTGGTVRTQVFAEPRRTESKKWQEFLEEPGITFRPVPRSTDHSREPNDEAIESTLEKLSMRRGVHRIALLTGDADFVDIMMKLQDTKPSYLVLVPEHCHGVARMYQENGIEVWRVKAIEGRAPRVRAILHEDGTGSVQVADLSDELSYDQEEYNLVEGFLEDLGYTGHPEPACAKFWYSNNLGRLTAFPKCLMTRAVHQVITKASKAHLWKRRSGRLAFVLPISEKGHQTQLQQKTYGNARSHSIFIGGGPFILKDSRDLTVRVLKRLRYLDEAMNTDEYEAMLCFINAKKNKTQLRKIGLLPEPSDCIRDVKEKLRAAFLSGECSAQWIQPAAAANQMKEIVRFLQQRGILSKKKERTGKYCSGYSKDDISQAIKILVRELKLPCCKTFRCLAWRVFSQRNKQDPMRRGIIEFRR